jgi:threonine dehydrogenase-like Zn-dependent dehydrogenase
MQAVAVFPHSRTVRLVEHPEPAIAGPHDVLVRILDVGVCGTDKEICAFQYGTPPAGSDHLVIGHESLGEVVAIGSAVTRVAPGDLVVPMVRRPCGLPECHACGQERQDFCFTGAFSERGIGSRHGFMTERIVDHEKYLNVVPRALRDVAVLTEPLTIAEKALRQIAEVQLRLPWSCPERSGRPADHCHRAVVLGAGPVGLLGAMALALRGFGVTVYSREPAPNPRSQLLASIGIGYASSQETPPEALAERIGNIDVVYEASGASAASFELMRVLGANGIFVFTGVPGRKAPISLDADFLMKRMVLNNQVLFGTVNADRAAFEAAIADLGAFEQRWPGATAQLITGRFPIEKHGDLLSGAVGGIKNVIQIGR